LSGIKFTGHTYKCPKCGAEIDGYMEAFWKTPKGKEYKGERPNEDSDEDNDEFFWKEVAGCVKCLDFWDAKELVDVGKEKVQFD